MTVAHDWLSYMGPFEEVENPSVGKDWDVHSECVCVLVVHMLCKTYGFTHSESGL